MSIFWAMFDPKARKLRNTIRYSKKIKLLYKKNMAHANFLINHLLISENFGDLLNLLNSITSDSKFNADFKKLQSDIDILNIS